MSRSLQNPGRVLGITLLATAANALPIPLPGDVPLFLGPFIYMPLVLALRAPWAVLAAGVPMAISIPVLHHPFAFGIALLEAGWLNWAGARTRRSALLIDGIFWAVISGPLFGWLAWSKGGLPQEIVLIMAAKQVFNQLAAVATAVFLLRHTSLHSWLTDELATRIRIRDMVLHAGFMLALVPMAVLGIGLAFLLGAYCDREDREDLQVTGTRMLRQLDLYLDLHRAMVASAARLLDRPGVDRAAVLAELRATHPAFLTMLVTDAAGQVVLASTAGNTPLSPLTRVDDRDYFTRARDSDRPYVSGVFRGRGFGRDILVAISAPLHDEQGRFAGVVEASLEVNGFAQLIAEEAEDDRTDFIFADAADRVIYAEPEAGIRPLTLLRHCPQGVLLGRGHRDDIVHIDAENRSGGRRRLSVTAVRSPQSGLLVLVQRPAFGVLEGAQWLFGLFLSLAAAVVIAAVFITRRVRLKTAEPLEQFATATNRQAALRIVEPIEGSFPGAPYEVWKVYQAFNRLAAEVQRSYSQLRLANEDLDRRVVERTAEAESARQQAEAASRSKTDFLAMTSHEIRTPLSAIIGLAEAEIALARAPETLRRLRTIEEAGRRMLTVVNDLLDLSRVEAGKLELRFAPVQLGPLCEEIRALFELRAQQRGLALLFEVMDPDEWLETDRVRIQQVLINLIGNALKFTSEGGITVRVTCDRESEHDLTVRFGVMDTGPGIPPDQQARLFQPYVQLPGAEQAAIPGTGLGLSICRRLVHLFGGRLALRSEPGQGSEFYFIVTMRRAVPPEEPPAPSSSAATEGTLRVLVADDNIANQEVLRSMLEPRCACFTAVDGATAALQELTRLEYDIALIDLEMPDGDGCSVARTIQGWTALEASRGCRLLAFSAHRREEVWARCAAAGFHDFVEKPIDRQQLLRAVYAPVPVGTTA